MQAFSRRMQGEGGRRRARTPLSRRFTYRYVIAIILFVGLGLAWKVTSDAALQRMSDLNHQLEQAASQPARIYRVVDLANRVTFQDPNALSPQQIEGLASQLEQESTLLTKVQDGLLNGDLQLELPQPTLSIELSQLYGDPDRLAQTVRSIGDAGKLIADLRNTGGSDPNASGRADQLAVITQSQDDAVRGLEKAVQLYTEQLNREIVARQNTTQLFMVLTVLLAVGVVLGMFRPMARSIHLETSQLENAERMHRENNERQTFRNELQQALEVTEHEDEVLAAVGRAIGSIVPENRVELLLSDPSKAHLRRSQVSPERGAAGCPVDSPEGCAAIRRGQSVVFESSRMLNVCPKLPEHEQGACSAVCVPVMFLGQSLGVLHTVGPDGQPPNHTQIERLSVLASETGNRLGTLQASQATQLQASTDGLTGLFNRRTLESKARGLMLDNRSYSIAMADLDHFKSLNDTHGHEAGDRALRLFASVLTANLRPGDVPARFGGEEFVVLLPGTPIREAHAAIERLQVSLAEEIGKAGAIAFTASWGLTDSSAGVTFDEIVAVADAALYSAKRAGRNCIMVDGEAAAAAGWTGSADDEPTAEGAAHHGDGDRPLLEIDMELLEAQIARPQPTDPTA